jgi:hypothetical protein
MTREAPMPLTVGLSIARRSIAVIVVSGLLSPSWVGAQPAPDPVPLAVRPGDVLATGNEWIALPEIRTSDGALVTFNTLSMRDRGLLQSAGEGGKPVLEPYLTVSNAATANAPQPLDALKWSLMSYWIPHAEQLRDGLHFTLTYCAPPGYRAAFVRLTLTNRRAEAVEAAIGLKSSFGSLARVTYVPVVLRGERTIGPAPWVDPGEVYSYITNDTRFAWAIVHPGSKATITVPPVSVAPQADDARALTLQPGETGEALFVLAVGIEEFSAAHNARSLREMLERHGADALIAETAAWCRARTRTTGHAELDQLMNRNLLFTRLYAWGRTIDTEQLVGVTSRSPRYYVSAAYWDRDAMLWSFPGLLDSDPQFAREALAYALGPQLANTGTHSRFIDGVVLEDGFELDEAAAPLIALGAYLRRTNDLGFIGEHREALRALRARLLSRKDAATGLYGSLQDAQDEFQKLPFITYDNVLTWRALSDLAAIFERLRDAAAAHELGREAAALHAAILEHTVVSGVPGADGPMFASATDGREFVETEIPPGSLMKLPILGFISEDDPLFVRTYKWLHSSHYKYSYADRAYGLPGSYRLPFTTSWMIADELLLKRSRDRAEKILLASSWDAGIISEGVNPESAVMERGGGAFATAAGYVAHAICELQCRPRP